MEQQPNCEWIVRCNSGSLVSQQLTQTSGVPLVALAISTNHMPQIEYPSSRQYKNKSYRIRPTPMAHSIRLWPETRRDGIGLDVCHRGCGYTVLQTVWRPGVWCAVYGTVHYKQSLHSFDKSRIWSRLWKQCYIRPPTPYFIVSASLVKTLEVIEFHIISYFLDWHIFKILSYNNYL